MNSRRTNDHRKWVLRTALCLAILLAAAMAFSLVVDPYDICRLAVIPGINQNKPAAPKHSRMTKPILQRRYRFQAVVMGSSRAEIGIDPEHPGWDPRFRPAYNYGLGAAGIEEIAERLDRLLQEQSVGQLVIGLDFFMFNATLGNPLAEEETGEPPADWRQWLGAVGTLDAFIASLETVRKQDRVRDPGPLPNGQIDTSFNLDRVSRFGHRKNFLRMERKFFEEDYFPPPDHVFRFGHPERDGETFDALRHILDLARARQIDLRLYLSPVHARLLEVIDQAGLWPQFEAWKRQMVEIVAREGASRGSEPFPLWDFSGYNSVTTEAVPPEGDVRTAMKYYWEGSHFKSQTGDLVLDRLFGWKEPGRDLPADFGLLLSPGNIEAQLADTRLKKEEYRQSHAEDVAEIAAIAKTVPRLNR